MSFNGICARIHAQPLLLLAAELEQNFFEQLLAVCPVPVQELFYH